MPSIELFGSPWCPPCDKAKKIIASTNPASKGVDFRYIDTSNDPSYAEVTLPIIMVGSLRLEGFDEVALRTALQELYGPPEPDVQTTVPDAPPDVPQPATPSNDKSYAGEITLLVFAALGFAAFEYFANKD